MAPKGLKPNPRTVTTLAVAAAMLFIGCVAVYLVAAGKLREARTELQAKQQAVEDSKRIAHRLSEAETAYRLAEEQLVTLEKAVSKKAYVPTLLRQLEELAHETHLRVISVRPEEVERPAPPAQQKAASGEGGESGDKKPADTQRMEPIKPYQTQILGVEVSGNYWNVMSFLYQVTTFPKILAVESLSAEPSSTNESLRSPTLMVKLRVIAFVFDEPQQAAPATVKPAAAPAGNDVQERKV